MTEDLPARSTVTSQEQVVRPEARDRERDFRAAPRLNKSPLHGLWALSNRDLL